MRTKYHSHDIDNMAQECDSESSVPASTQYISPTTIANIEIDPVIT